MLFKISVKKQWLSLILLGLGFAFVYLDSSALNIALPFIKSQFNATTTQMFWAVNAYILSTAGFCLAGGRMGDFIGFRNTFILGVFLFAIASLGCALSFSIHFLILARLFQGLGAALVITNAVSIIYHIFPQGRQGKAVGIFGACVVGFLALGPIVGGLFTEYLTWRWIFLINPIAALPCILGLYLILQGLDDQRHRGVKFDYIGQLLFTLFLVPLVIASMQAEAWGWGSAIIISCFSAAVIFLTVFIFYELKKKHPLFDVRLFKKSNFSVGMFIFFASQFAAVSNVMYAIYLQKSLLFSPFHAGLGLIPSLLFPFVGNPIAGFLSDKWGHKHVMQLGVALGLLGFLWFVFIAHSYNYILFALGLLITSLVFPLIMVPGYIMLMNTAPKHQKGMASGVITAVRQSAGAIFVSVMGLIVTLVQNPSDKGTLATQKVYANGLMYSMSVVALFFAISFFLSFKLKAKEFDPIK